MTYQEIATMVSGIGLDYCYYQFELGPDDPPPQLPYVCFYYERNNDMEADDSNYQTIVGLVVELYSESKDFEHEATVESALAGAGLVYGKLSDYIDSERMYLTTYTMEVCINNGEQD